MRWTCSAAGPSLSPPPSRLSRWPPRRARSRTATAPTSSPTPAASPRRGRRRSAWSTPSAPPTGCAPSARSRGSPSASAAYSRRMVAQQFFDHVAPDGSTLVAAPDGGRLHHRRRRLVGRREHRLGPGRPLDAALDRRRVDGQPRPPREHPQRRVHARSAWASRPAAPSTPPGAPPTPPTSGRSRAPAPTPSTAPPRRPRPRRRPAAASAKRKVSAKKAQRPLARPRPPRRVRPRPARRRSTRPAAAARRAAAPAAPTPRAPRSVRPQVGAVWSGSRSDRSRPPGRPARPPRHRPRAVTACGRVRRRPDRQPRGDAPALRREARHEVGLSGLPRPRLQPARQERAQEDAPAPAHRGQVPAALRGARRLEDDAGHTLVQDPPARAPQRPHRLGDASCPSATSRRSTPASSSTASTLRVTLFSTAGKRLPGADRRRQVLDPHAGRPLLGDREVPRPRRAGLRHARRSGPARTPRRSPTGRAAASSACTARTSPGCIPGRPSHGCIRLRNRDIVRLYRLAPTGTPVDIR